MTGAFPHPLSLNEVEQLSLKAVRGAGCSWGVAEDAARASRWLAARGIGWAPPLLDLLRADPPAGAFVAALAIADRLARAVTGDRWRIEGCPPGWLLPALSAARPTLPLLITWSTSRVLLNPDGSATLDRQADDAGLFAPAAARVEVVADASPLPHALPATTRRGFADPGSLADLEAFALRTAVPASAQSRAAGAGGGRVDDD